MLVLLADPAADIRGRIPTHTCISIVSYQKLQGKNVLSQEDRKHTHVQLILYFMNTIAMPLRHSTP